MAYTMGAFVFAMVIFSGWGNMIESWRIGEFEGELPVRVPTYPVRTLLLLGAALTSIQFLILLKQTIQFFEGARRKGEKVMDPLTIAIISVAFVFFFILMGVHIGVSLATVSVLGIWAITGKASVAINILQTTSYSAVMDYMFAVIPLFVLMGLFSTQSGATQELFDSAQYFLGRVRGGLGIATVLANAVFAAITGVSVASAAVFSKIAFPEMERLQYDRKFGLGIIAGSAILGMLIPPSILMIIYGVLTEQSIGKLFIAGIVPGLVVTGVISFGIWSMIGFNPRLGGFREKPPKMNLSSFLKAIATPWAVVGLIVLVMGGIWGGLFTPTEAGAVGAAGGFLLVVIKRKFTFKRALANSHGRRANLLQHLSPPDLRPDVQPDADHFGFGHQDQRLGDFPARPAGCHHWRVPHGIHHPRLHHRLGIHSPVGDSHHASGGRETWVRSDPFCHYIHCDHRGRPSHASLWHGRLCHEIGSG